MPLILVLFHKVNWCVSSQIKLTAEAALWSIYCHYMVTLLMCLV